jgi:CRISPR-associated protein (TIGR02710 family)
MIARADRPVFLICTVGGSPQPIATALRLLRPDVVWFLVSDGKSGESSASQIERLKLADGCPAQPQVLGIPADDPDAAYKKCRALLAQARKLHPDHRVIADYTGGTKSMTGALLMAAFAQPGVEVQFMVGERADLVQVKPGSEKPQLMAADFIVAERDFAAAEQAVDGYDYAAAQRLLHGLRARLQRAGVKPPKAWSRHLEQALAWTGVMSHWDAFSHGAAAQRAQDRMVASMLEATKHLAPLLAIGKREKGKPGWDICADLWLNALRRGERGRYDDAIARLYRLLEAAAQAHLWERYGLESGRVSPTELPAFMRSQVLMKADRKNGARYAQLALHQTVELLRARDPGDAFAAAYAGADALQDRFQGPPWLTKRNHSILAHGFVSVDDKAWNEARAWVETNVAKFFSDCAFPQLPRRIPSLESTAV